MTAADAVAEVRFYGEAGPMTTLDGIPAQLLEGMPTDPVGIADRVQGLVLHPSWANSYGVSVPEERLAELQIRSATRMIERIVAIDARPVAQRRSPEHRLVGNCRHFAVLTVALLRHASVPARARCGFSSYFERGKWVDHWIVEHHDGKRWVRLDPQIDNHQRRATGLDADPTDLPPGLFLPAGAAWLACRSGDQDGDRFGIMDQWGQWFIKGNIVRDLAALNKVEMLPWDGWSDLEGPVTNPDDLPILDDIAALTVSDDLAQIQRRYETDDRLRARPRVLRFFPGPIEDTVAELT